MLAQKLLNTPLSEPKPRKKSKPPKKIISPTITMMCISNFLSLGNINAKTANRNTGNPTIDGIRDVIELLPLNEVTTKPQVIKIIPYTIDIISMFIPKTVNSFLFIFAHCPKSY
jgi:hypothetical protein|tara:strand:+ start:1368 stop:1709 length:342 start_codon:yes stop_codon:yes gene_type:complete